MRDASRFGIVPQTIETMKQLEKNEIYDHLSGFLKVKGIALTDGSYSRGVEKICTALTEVINLGQRGVGKAKTEIDAKLDQVRQCIHEKTAPPVVAVPPIIPPTAPPPTAAKPPGAKRSRAEKKNTRRRPRRPSR